MNPRHWYFTEVREGVVEIVEGAGWHVFTLTATANSAAARLLEERARWICETHNREEDNNG